MELHDPSKQLTSVVNLIDLRSLSVFSEVVLLRDFLEHASVALKKALRGIYALAIRDALSRKFHVQRPDYCGA
jgi:hypothetical protein